MQSIKASKLDSWTQESLADLTSPCLILCEGKGDASFFKTLLDSHGITGFQIGFPFPTDDEAIKGHGRSAFGEYLKVLALRAGYDEILKCVVVVTDNDDPPRSFNETQVQIQKGGYPVPSQPEVIISGPKDIVVLLIPKIDEPGNLESLLTKSISPTIVQCALEYLSCNQIQQDALSAGAFSKMLFSSIVTSCCKKNPSCTIPWLWGEEGNPVSLEHECFAGVLSFFRGIVGAYV